MVNIYKQKLTILQQEIMRLLFIKVGPLNARKIAKCLEVSPPAVAKAIPHLHDLELIKIKQDESRRWLIELNTSNPKIIQLKRADNLKQVYESGLADFLEKEFPESTIILFGAYSKGMDVSSSNVEIAIIGKENRAVGLHHFNRLLEREILITFHGSFNRVPKNIRKNILEGIVLKGNIQL